MDIINFYSFIKNVIILEKYDLPHTFFTEPIREYDAETCLHEIIRIIVTHKIKFPKRDTSDLIEFIRDKDTFHYPTFTFHTIKLAPFTHSNEPLIQLLCFMKAYASHTYKYKGSFKEHFKKVFDVFYSMNIMNS
jgi:hypothetical protein